MGPPKIFAEVIRREEHKYDKCDHLLDGFQLCSAESAVAIAVGGHLQYVFKESDAPTHEDDGQQWRGLELQMSVPCERHKKIRYDEQTDRNDGGGDMVHISTSKEKKQN